MMASSLLAQEVAKTIVVEHFTNTRCGVCANRNPGFYANLNNQQGVLHLAVHPSSPYSNCVFNNVNQVENDGRTNYYGIYGSTPKLVIQGENISPGANYGDPAIFSPYQNQSTPVSMDIYQSKTSGAFSSRIVIKAAADNSIGTASLFLPIAEDEVMYNAPNGENLHYDVFRKSINDEPEGISVSVPATAGDSIELTFSTSVPGSWELDNLYLLAILQSAADKAVIQAAASDPADNFPVISNTNEALRAEVRLSPNPVKDILQIAMPSLSGVEKELQLFSLDGRLLLSSRLSDTHTELDLAGFADGAYLLRIYAEGKSAAFKIVKK